jgi:hypothetical protein
MSVSAFNRRWKQSNTGRKWPHRRATKYQKDIENLLYNYVGKNGVMDRVPDEISNRLMNLLEKRQELLLPSKIRIK